MVANGGVAAIGERTRAPIADAGQIVRVSTEDSGLDFGHETAVLVPDNLPYNLIVLHLLPISKSKSNWEKS